jgi:hypothetical protein
MRANDDEAVLDFDCPVHDRLRQRGPAMLTTGVDSADDRAFSDLLGAFCCHGGLVNGNEVAKRLVQAVVTRDKVHILIGPDWKLWNCAVARTCSSKNSSPAR